MKARESIKANKIPNNLTKVIIIKIIFFQIV